MLENKIQELQNKIDSLQNELNELKNSKEIKYRCGRVDKDGLYYFIGYDNLTLCSTRDTQSDDDNHRYKAGNYFIDRKLAEELLQIYKRNPMYLIALLCNCHYYEQTGTTVWLR